MLIDTPGLESIFRHNSDAARDGILAADGAGVVLSADAPLGEGEQDLLQLVAERSARTFFVLNRIDHLTPAEAEHVRAFVAAAIEEVTGVPPPLYCVSARAALDARVAGDRRAFERSGFSEFDSAFRSFLDEELVQARVLAARTQLARLAVHAEAECSVEEAALRLSAAELHERSPRSSTQSASNGGPSKRTASSCGTPPRP